MKKVLFGNTNKVLFISYAFPPMGGGGIFRIVKFVKFLPEFGILPRVLTVENHFHPYNDETLLKQIPSEVEVTRINYNEPALWAKNRFWQSFLNNIWYPWFSISDKRIPWKSSAVKKAVEIIKKEKIDTIFTSFAAAADHLIALEVKKQTGVNWVADFRDEWASSNYYYFPTPLHRRHVSNLEKEVVMAADKVIAVSPPMTSYFAKLSGDKEKCLTITNGFDREDFDQKFAVPKRDYCQILYSGAFYGERSADTFNEALKELNLPDLKVDFFGGENRISHHEAIQKQCEADILLLVLSPNDRPAVFTGKIFEYLAARRPILCLAPQKTAAAQLINKLGVGEVIEPLDKEGIKAAILRMYQAWKDGKLTIPQIDLKPYDREYLTQNLADVFNSLPVKKLKVMLVANTRSPQSAKLATYLLSQNYEIHFVSLDGSTIEGVINYHIKQKALVNRFYPWYLFAGFLNKYRALSELKKLISEIKPDVVHGHGVNFGGILAVYSGFHPVVVTTRGSDLMQIENQPGFEQYLICKAIQNADIVTGNSVALQKKALKLGVSPKKWQEVYFGINTEIFKKQDASDLRKKLNIANEKIIFSARSLKPIYNIDILIHAVGQLEDKNWKMILMEQNKDQGYATKIKALIKTLNLEDKIIFLPQVDTEQMAELYNLADVVVTIAKSDGAAATFLEAMACEAKIVISDVDFVSEWADGKFWTVPIGDIEKTAEAIDQALNTSKTDFSSDGAKNRQIIVDRAELNNSFKKFEDIYRDLTERKQ
jgi:glycosyltransferase involved in cell wall biosynthesis